MIWRETAHESGNPMRQHELVSGFLTGYERYAFDEMDYIKT